MFVIYFLTIRQVSLKEFFRKFEKYKQKIFLIFMNIFLLKKKLKLPKDFTGHDLLDINLCIDSHQILNFRMCYFQLK